MVIVGLWQEKITPILYFKDDQIFGCKLKTYGFHGSGEANWFGNIYSYKYFVKKVKPFTLLDELFMLFFEVLNFFIFARFYIIILFLSLAGLLWAIIHLDFTSAVVGITILAMFILWPRICSWAHRHFVEDIPINKGWNAMFYPHENFFEFALEKNINEDELRKWLKK